jgi:hypothetical protein
LHAAVTAAAVVHVIITWQKGGPPMRRSSLALLFAGSAILFAMIQAAAGELCRPALLFKETCFSEVRNLQRTWTAALAVDASRCATNSGRFDLFVTREKENAPDLQFVERFTWKPGRIEVSLDFWRDEAVLDYSIGYVEPCACRK